MTTANINHANRAADYAAEYADELHSLETYAPVRQPSVAEVRDKVHSLRAIARTYLHNGRTEDSRICTNLALMVQVTALESRFAPEGELHTEALINTIVTIREDAEDYRTHDGDYDTALTYEECALHFESVLFEAPMPW